MVVISMPHAIRSRAVRLFAAAVLLVANVGVHAFGADGHRMVAELAQRQLSPAAAAQVKALLAGEADPSLAGIAIWADEVRETEAYRWSAPLHYVNFPRQDSCRYDAPRDCRDGRCVVGALERYSAVLADRQRPRAERLEALKFVVHFAGDIHQPMHAGYADDRGGNRFQVFYLGRGGNLHALWDGGILRRPRREWRDYVDVLAARQPPPLDAAWSSGAPRRWAQESCRLIASERIYPARPGKLPDGYVDRQLPVVEQRVRIAGDRLAALLNAVLGPAPAGRKPR
jgi:hypothetical protein